MRLTAQAVRTGLLDDHPAADDAIAAMLSVAAREVDEAWLASWIRDRVTFRT